jgi:hypothetical protein
LGPCVTKQGHQKLIVHVGAPGQGGEELIVQVSVPCNRVVRSSQFMLLPKGGEDLVVHFIAP